MGSKNGNDFCVSEACALLIQEQLKLSRALILLAWNLPSHKYFPKPVEIAAIKAANGVGVSVARSVCVCVGENSMLLFHT